MADTNNTSSVTVDIAALQAELAKAKAENEALKAAKERKLTCKVSEKGALSVYGLSARFPTTLYKGQWERLIAAVPAIQAFIAAHPELKTKEEAVAAAAAKV